MLTRAGTLRVTPSSVAGASRAILTLTPVQYRDLVFGLVRLACAENRL